MPVTNNLTTPSPRKQSTQTHFPKLDTSFHHKKFSPLATSALEYYDKREAMNCSELSVVRADASADESNQPKAVYMNLAGTEVYYRHDSPQKPSQQ